MESSIHSDNTHHSRYAGLFRGATSLRDLLDDLRLNPVLEAMWEAALKETEAAMAAPARLTPEAKQQHAANALSLSNEAGGMKTDPSLSQAVGHNITPKADVSLRTGTTDVLANLAIAEGAV